MEGKPTLESYKQQVVEELKKLGCHKEPTLHELTVDYNHNVEPSVSAHFF